MLKSGKLIISLDFELLWGIFDTVEPLQKKAYFQNTKKLIPQILALFKKYDVHATWATVGMLFNKNWEEWGMNKPSNLPKYKNKNLSPYFFKQNTDYRAFTGMCFAPQLVKEISEVPGQEIGTHTYSHYYCLEEGQTPEQFKEDMEQAVKMAHNMGITLKSLVFPRNQLQEEYLKICFELGITSVRSNPNSWYWENTRSTAITTKLARTGDAYFPLGKKSYPISEIKKTAGLPVAQKASRFYRPVEGNTFLRKLKLKRVMGEMSYAAKNNEIYHLWWHPHNFGENPKESLADLQKILEHFSQLNHQFNFESKNMQEITRIL